MKSRLATFIVALTFFAVLSIPDELTAEKRIRYVVIDLGTLGGTFSQAFGINNRGFVVGFATTTGDAALHAFLWSKGLMTDLGTLAPLDNLPYSVANSINDSDEIVGFSETSTPDPLGENFCGDSVVCLPVLWRNGVISTLPTLGGNNGQAAAINNSGQVVGIAENARRDATCPAPQVLVTKPVVWENGTVHALPTAPFREGTIGSEPGPAGNNDKGQIVGNTETCSFSSIRDVLWDQGRAIDMGTIGGTSFAAIAINSNGQATGTYTPPDGINRAFIWQDGIASDLGTLPGDNFAEGGGINNRGQIVGQSCSATTCSVFVWRSGVMTDLNAVIRAGSSLYPIAAHGVNARGEIAGWGFQNATGEQHGFLAIPCDDEHANEKACENASAPAANSQPRSTSKFNVPEKVRPIFLGRMGSRYRMTRPRAPD